MVAVAAGDESTGRRIARHRKIRGLTQRGLAMRANVAYGTLTKVESGHALPSAAVVAAIARALSVNVATLTGQPFHEELRAAKVDQLVEPLRVALDSYDLSPPEDVAPRSLEAIERDVIDLCDEAMCGGVVAKAAAKLPSLIDEVSVFAASDDERAWRALASAYRCVRHVTLNWGYRDLGDIALDRATWAGTNGDDPLAEAVRNRARASNHLRAGSYETGRQLLAGTLRMMDGAASDLRRDTLAGHTHLGWAVNAARSGDLDDAGEHLDAAERLAERTGEAPTVGWFGFGPTNVAVHRVATLIEAGRYGPAIDTAESLRIPLDWPPTRTAHHHMDLVAPMQRRTSMTRRSRSWCEPVSSRRCRPDSTRRPARRSSTSSPVDAACPSLWPPTHAGWACRYFPNLGKLPRAATSIVVCVTCRDLRRPSRAQARRRASRSEGRS